MVILEGIIIMLEEDLQKFWKFHNDQFKLDNSSLNFLHQFLRVWTLFAVKFEVIISRKLFNYYTNCELLIFSELIASNSLVKTLQQLTQCTVFGMCYIHQVNETKACIVGT